MTAKTHLHLAGDSRRPLIQTDAEREALARAAAIWEGCPHRPGERRPGRDGGVDCIHLIEAIYDGLYEALGCATELRNRGPLPRVAQDAGLHDLRAGLKTVQWFKARYPHERVPMPALPDDRSWTQRERESITMRVRPGDVLVLRVGRRANHMAFVGSPKGMVWHAMGGSGGGRAKGCVGWSALGDPQLLKALVRIYRPLRSGAPA
jgi:hypothetical protein